MIIPSLHKTKSQGRTYKHENSFDYTNPKWRVLRARKLISNPYCECPDCEGKKVKADMVDHKVRIEDGGDPYAWDNLQSMRNHPCHDRKRAREKNQKYAKLR
jgi:hypothetical protein